MAKQDLENPASLSPELDEQKKPADSDAIAGQTQEAAAKAIESPTQQFEWAETSVPENLKAILGKALESAAAPLFEQEFVSTKEIEVSRVVKGRLPFLPSKEEKVSTTLSETKKLIVEVNSKVLSHNYFEKGAVLGRFAEAQTSQPESFLVGKNLERNGSTVRALVSGIVRLGSNWIDLVPLVDHSWSLSQSEDKSWCYFDFAPGSNLIEAPNADAVLLAARQLGYKPEMLLQSACLGFLIQNASLTGNALVKHNLGLNQDSVWQICVSKDNLKAVLNCMKAFGDGKALELKALGSTLNASNVKYSKDKVKKDIMNWYSSNEKYLASYLLAEGKPAETAPAQTLSINADEFDKKLAPQLLETIKKSGLPLSLSSVFPCSAIVGLYAVAKDQRPLTLGPLLAGKPGMDVFGKIVPALETKKVDLKLFGSLELMGSNLISVKSAGILALAKENDRYFAACFPHADAEVQVQLSDDRLLAWISVFARLGLGKGLSASDINAALDKAGVKKGINQEVLQAIVSKASTGEAISRLEIAQGKAASGGSENQINYQIQFASGQKVRQRSDGSIDFRNQDRYTTVSKDAVIAEMAPPTELPSPGFDVTGKELAPVVDPSLALIIGKGIKVSKREDGISILVAEYDGELIREKNSISINPAFTIKGNVDTSTGNIKFPGAVSVTGDVMSGFSIVCGGEIKIGGSVEASLLSSESDILIQNGVKGAGKALLRSKKNVGAGFIELCTIMAVGDIHIKKALLRSKVKCNGKIVSPDDAHIFGGEINVRSGLHVGNLGNQTGVRTKVFFGQDILVADQISVEEKEIVKIQNELVSINSSMINAQKNADKSLMQLLINRKVLLMKALEKRNLRLFTLKERYEQHFDSEIVVKGTLWPGVVIESHGRLHEVSKPTKAVKIVFDTATGHIVESPIGQKPS